MGTAIGWWYLKGINKMEVMFKLKMCGSRFRMAREIAYAWIES